MLIKYTLFVIVLFISHCFCWKPIIRSVDSSTPRISQKIKEIIINQASYQYQSLPPIQNINIPSIDWNKGQPISLTYPSINGDIGSNDITLIKVTDLTNRNKIIKSDEVSFSLINDVNTLNSSSSLNHNDCYYNSTENNDYNVKCDYHLSQLSYIIEQFNFKIQNKIVKTLRLLQLSLVLINGKVDILSYDGYKLLLTNIKEYEIGSDYLNDTSIKDFFVINQWGIEEKYIIVQSNEALRIYCVHFNWSNPSSVELKINATINWNDCNAIKAFGIFNSKLLIGVENKGILMLDMVSNQRKYLNHIEEVIKIINFVIENEYLYVACKGIGLSIYNLANMDQEPFKLSLSHINYIDLHTHPFYGTHFIGIGLNQYESNSEFFLEFIIQKQKDYDNDKKIVILNKVLTAKDSQSISLIHSMDNFNTFFYSNTTKEIYIIRRGLSSHVTFITYSIPLGDEYLQGLRLFSVLNTHSNRNNLLFFSKQSVILIRNLTYDNNTLSCVFKGTGSYIVSFRHKTDVCNSSIVNKSLSINQFCIKTFNLQFNIYKDSKVDVLDILLYYFSFLFVVLTFVLAFIIWKDKQWHHRKNELKIKENNPKDIWTLYLIDNNDNIEPKKVQTMNKSHQLIMHKKNFTEDYNSNSSQRGNLRTNHSLIKKAKLK